MSAGRKRARLIAGLAAAALLVAPAASPAAPAAVLGPPDVSGYCHSLGYVRSTVIPGTPATYGCQRADGSAVPVQPQAACESSYAQRPIAAEEATPGVLYTLRCVQGAPAPGSGSGGSGINTGLPSPAQRALRLAASPARSCTIKVLLSRRGCSARYTASAAGRLTVGWYERRAHGAPVLVAAGAASVAAGASVTVHIRVTARGRRALAHARKASITARAAFTSSGSRVALSPPLAVTLRR